MTSLLHPFDPSINKPRPNSDGSYSTEITRTVQLPDGSWVNVPSLWWGEGNTVRDFGTMSDDQLAGFAMRYEQMSGQQFPRYRNLGGAEEAARNRSAAGGGTQGQLSRPPLPTPPTPTLGSTGLFALGGTVPGSVLGTNRPPPVPPVPLPRPSWLSGGLK